MSARALWAIPALLFLVAAPAFAEPRVDLKDLDEDGFKETKDTFEGSKQVLREQDLNKDGTKDKTTHYKAGVKATAEFDRDYDGVIETWITYDREGAMALLAKDSNADGKPDRFQKFLKGPQLILKEYDQNFDGRVDRRLIAEWTMIRYVPGGPKTPGYRNIMREEDSDFDGKIDKYREKGNKDGDKKIGLPIDTRPAEKDPDKPKPAAGGGGTGGAGGGKVTVEKERLDKLVDTMNERYGLEDSDAFDFEAQQDAEAKKRLKK